jgi:hypothetical protein
MRVITVAIEREKTDDVPYGVSKPTTETVLKLDVPESVLLYLIEQIATILRDEKQATTEGA